MMSNLASTVRFARRVLDVLLVILIAVALTGVVLGKLVPLTGRQTLVVGGSSMAPAIPLGAAVVVTPVPAASLAVGDVVSLRVGPKSSIFTHRIVRLVEQDGETWVETKGDANSVADPTLVPASSIIGRVSWSIPWAGYLLALMSLPLGVLFILGVAGSLLAGAWLLETLELRDGPGAGRILRKVPADRPAAERGPWTAGIALPASPTGEAVARHFATSGRPRA